MTIRPATSQDCGTIHTMIRELADFEKLSHQVTSTPYDLKMALFGEVPAAECLIAEDDHNSDLMGFALFFSNYSTFTGKRGLYLEDLYVRPQFRGSGTGKKLIQAVIQSARDRGSPRLDWAVLDWNQTAIEFYQSLGAEVMPDWRICRLDL